MTRSLLIFPIFLIFVYYNKQIYDIVYMQSLLVPTFLLFRQLYYIKYYKIYALLEIIILL